MIKENRKSSKEEKLLSFSRAEHTSITGIRNCPEWILNSLEELVTGELWEELKSVSHEATLALGACAGAPSGKW